MGFWSGIRKKTPDPGIKKATYRVKYYIDCPAVPVCRPWPPSRSDGCRHAPSPGSPGTPCTPHNIIGLFFIIFSVTTGCSDCTVCSSQCWQSIATGNRCHKQILTAFTCKKIYLCLLTDSFECQVPQRWHRSGSMVLIKADTKTQHSEKQSPDIACCRFHRI